MGHFGITNTYQYIPKHTEKKRGIKSPLLFHAAIHAEPYQLPMTYFFLRPDSNASVVEEDQV